MLLSVSLSSEYDNKILDARLSRMADAVLIKINYIFTVENVLFLYFAFHLYLTRAFGKKHYNKYGFELLVKGPNKFM